MLATATVHDFWANTKLWLGSLARFALNIRSKSITSALLLNLSEVVIYRS